MSAAIARCRKSSSAAKLDSAPSSRAGKLFCGVGLEDDGLLGDAGDARSGEGGLFSGDGGRGILAACVGEYCALGDGTGFLVGES